LNRTTEFTVPLKERQLFLDSHGVAYIESLTRTMHQPEKKGAVIRSFDQHGVAVQQVILDPDREIWKAWCSPPRDIRAVVAYWESDDGLHWRKPILGQVEYHGSKENNLVSIDLGKGTGKFGPGAVVYDPNDPDPDRRYKCALPPHGFGVSPDGINWTGFPTYVRNEDSYTFSLDEREGLFILLMREGGHEDRRVILSTSSDFEHWTDPELVFRADDLDQEIARETIERHFQDPTLQAPEFSIPATYNAQAYWMKMFRYESHYIALPMMFYRSGEAPGDWEGFESLELSPPVQQRLAKEGDWTGIHVIQLACSRDLRNWERLGDRVPFIGPSKLGGGAYDTQGIYLHCQPIVHGNELWFYYTGARAYAIISEDKPDQKAVCLAVLRRDGFMSLDSGNGHGTVTTRPFKVPDGRLSVNVDAAHGRLHVEVLESNGDVVARSVPVIGDQPDTTVRWEDGGLFKWIGREVSLRFHLRNARLFSYWVG
jgi:hypothetical protein